MEKQQSILFITNSELGQSTVILAVAHEFLLRPRFDVHIASFPALTSSITELNNDAALFSAGGATTASFHIIAGKSMKQSSTSKTDFLEMHPSGISGAIFAYDNVLPATFAPWEGSDYMVGYSSCVEIINNVRPDIVAIDPLFSQAVDACNSLNIKCVILSPNTFKELVLNEQPGLSALYKFPAMASGFPYPLPWYYILVNFYLMFKFLKARRTSPRLVELATYRNECGLQGKIPCMFEGFGRHPILLPSTLAIDFDFHIPSQVTPCGPILRPFAPISKTHPELESWLSQRPTVLVNLGSHIIFDADFAAQFAAGLRVLLDRRPDVQVLWKLKTEGQSKDQLRDVLSVIAIELENGRVRIESWLPAQPIAILESGNVICMIHHGGANSYHEAISAGVPQIVLPVWVDTYDFAIRAEYLGIGAWGSRTAAPRVEGSELGRAMMRVIDSNESAGMAAKAKILAAPFRKQEGRVVAFDKIVELMS